MMRTFVLFLFFLFTWDIGGGNGLPRGREAIAQSTVGTGVVANNPFAPQAEQALQEGTAIRQLLRPENARIREAIRQVNRQPRIYGSHSPDILFIVAHDLGYGELGSYGQQKIATPNLDRLAATGVRYTNYYAGGTTDLTALFPLMTGQQLRYGPWLTDPGVRLPMRCTLAEVLWQAGYTTHGIGRWGFNPQQTGTPNQQGFETWYGLIDPAQIDNVFPPSVWRDGQTIPVDANAAGAKGLRANALFTAEALRLLDAKRGLNPDGPFDKHANGQIVSPQQARKGLHRPFFLYMPFQHETPSIATDPAYANQDWPAAAKGYASALTRFDTDVGRVLDRLVKLGLDQNTLIFFTTDTAAINYAQIPPALFRSTGPLRGFKGSLNEGGLRIPMIIRPPGGAKGSESPQIWAAWDVLPTLAAMAGAIYAPGGLDGAAVPLSPVAVSATERPLYWENRTPDLAQAVRNGQWKGIRPGPGKQMELYDLVADPGETKNRASTEAVVVKRLDQLMAGGQARSGTPSLAGR